MHPGLEQPLEQLGGDEALFTSLSTELDRTIQSVLAIRGRERLLQGNPMLRGSIELSSSPPPGSASSDDPGAGRFDGTS